MAATTAVGTGCQWKLDYCQRRRRGRRVHRRTKEKQECKTKIEIFECWDFDRENQRVGRHDGKMDILSI